MSTKSDTDWSDDLKICQNFRCRFTRKLFRYYLITLLYKSECCVARDKVIPSKKVKSKVLNNQETFLRLTYFASSPFVFPSSSSPWWLRSTTLTQYVTLLIKNFNWLNQFVCAMLLFTLLHPFHFTSRKKNMNNLKSCT